MIDDNKTIEVAARTLLNYQEERQIDFSRLDEEFAGSREKFLSSFSIEKLSSLPDERILQSMFLSGTSNNLCNALENTFTKSFGSIGIANSKQHYLWFSQKNKSWSRADGNSYINISEADALVEAKRIRASLIVGYDYLKSCELNSVQDYVELQARLEILMGAELYKLAWIRKYFYVSFPEKLVQWNADGWLDFYLNEFGIQPGKGYYVKMGQLALVKRASMLSEEAFWKLTEKKFGVPGERTSKNAAEWWPSLEDYNPELTIEQWESMLGDSSVITEHSRLLLCRLLDYGGEATCKQLSEKYGEAPTFYSSNAVAAAKRVYEEAECPLPPDRINEGSRWWPILFVGRHADKEAAGKYIWKLRPELKAALERLEYCHRQNYWWLNASPRVWSLSNMLIGDEIDYTLLNDKEHKRRVYQNFIDAKAGDIVIGYEANPAKQIVAFLEVSKASDGERIWFKKIEGLDEPIDWSDFSELSELQDMEFLKIRNGSLFKVAEDEYDVLLNLIREVNSPPLAIENKSFAQEDFLENVFMDQKEYLELVELLENKRNLILQGAPGVGKTYAARLLAYSILGEVDKKKVKLIQFHQNYSYEDFMMGYRPVEDRFELKKGVFYKFCREASNNPDNKYFLLIDEINRGNMSKIFGELLMLIEKTYRGEPIALAYNEELFSVPKNLYIVGMMNTADRSIALIDYALRRRFSFYEMTPAFGKPSFDVYQEGLGSKSFDSLIRQIVELNDEIAKDSSLGNGFMLGHSYFCNRTKVDCTREWLEQIVKFELVPALKEYWFDDPEKVTKWESRLLESLNA